MMTSCPNSYGNFTVTITAIAADGSAKMVFQTTAAVRARAEIGEISSSFCVVFIQAAYLWNGIRMTFIDTIEIIQPTESNRLVSHRVLVT
jgi:hypothetical protein